jgi:putative SOS response-associated peptidase YedK
VVVLDKEQWLNWLDPAFPEKELLRPSPAGSLNVEKIERQRGAA